MYNLDTIHSTKLSFIIKCSRFVFSIATSVLSLERDLMMRTYIVFKRLGFSIGFNNG